jgi:hypothetical protein
VDAHIAGAAIEEGVDVGDDRTGAVIVLIAEDDDGQRGAGAHEARCVGRARDLGGAGEAHLVAAALGADGDGGQEGLADAGGVLGQDRAGQAGGGLGVGAGHAELKVDGGAGEDGDEGLEVGGEAAGLFGHAGGVVDHEEDVGGRGVLGLVEFVVKAELGVLVVGAGEQQGGDEQGQGAHGGLGEVE